VIQDSNGRLVTYGSSRFAYHIKSHPRGTKRPLDENQEQENTKRRRRDHNTGSSGTNSGPGISPASSGFGYVRVQSILN